MKAITIEPRGWFSKPEVAIILRVSRRTMQRLREIIYLIRGGKTWYSLAKVKCLLSDRKAEKINSKEASYE